MSNTSGQKAERACAYPEGTLPAEVLEDVIVMSLSDLVEAYDRTASGEDTLFEPEPEPVEEEEDLPGTLDLLFLIFTIAE